MLRHSFALRWYAIGKSGWENRISHLSDWERRDFRDQFGDTWNVIQGLLGHSSVETTRNIYLEPFRNLSTGLLLEQVDDDDFAQMQMRVLSGNPRVADDPLRQGGAS
jgi:integrase